MQMDVPRLYRGVCMYRGEVLTYQDQVNRGPATQNFTEMLFPEIRLIFLRFEILSASPWCTILEVPRENHFFCIIIRGDYYDAEKCGFHAESRARVLFFPWDTLRI